MAKRKSRKSPRPRQAKISRARPKLAKIPKQKTRSLAQLYSRAKRLGLIKSKRKTPSAQAKKQISQLRDVLEGRAVALPISPKSAKSRRQAGYKIVNNKIILPLQKGVRYKIGRGRTIVETRKIKFGNIKIILTPYSYTDLQQGLDILEHDPEIQGYLDKGWKLALRFKTEIRDYYSHQTMSSFPALRDYLERYDSISERRFPTNLDLIMVVLTKRDLQHQNVFEEQRYERARKRNPRRYKSTYNPKAYQSRKRRDPGFMERKRKASREAMRRKRGSKRKYKK